MKIKFGLYDADGNAITGSTVLKCKIKRDADDWFYDFNDSTFKASGHTTIAAIMAEPDSTNAPGEYEKSATATAWNDGIYTVYVNYTGTPKQNGSEELVIVDGTDMAGFLTRLYQSGLYKMNVTDATGIAAIRNKGDSADLATGQITDNGTTTTRAKWTW